MIWNLSKRSNMIVFLLLIPLLFFGIAFFSWVLSISINAMITGNADWEKWGAISTAILSLMTCLALLHSYNQNKKSLKISEKALEYNKNMNIPLFEEYTTFLSKNREVFITVVNNVGGKPGCIKNVTLIVKSKNYEVILQDISEKMIVLPGSKTVIEIDLVKKIKEYGERMNQINNLIFTIIVDYVHVEYENYKTSSYSHKVLYNEDEKKYTEKTEKTHRKWIKYSFVAIILVMVGQSYKLVYGGEITSFDVASYLTFAAMYVGIGIMTIACYISDARDRDERDRHFSEFSEVTEEKIRNERKAE